LVRDVRCIGRRLRIEATIPNGKVIGVGKYGHGGNEIDRRWEQKAVKFMPTCEHKSQTNQPKRILPMFDLSPPDDSPTLPRITTSPLSEKTAAGREWIFSKKEGFNDRHERAEAGRCIA